MVTFLQATVNSTDPVIFDSSDEVNVAIILKLPLTLPVTGTEILRFSLARMSRKGTLMTRFTMPGPDTLNVQLVKGKSSGLVNDRPQFVVSPIWIVFLIDIPIVGVINPKSSSSLQICLVSFTVQMALIFTRAYLK